ncbi:hypothetical protein SLS62_010055 [Diatrype stigma]|uniref:Uncharacterized protein n=1 Tax=Diatrype stigma TaxID=117547 RepID=A0AAN9YH89_9PEZI
MHLTGKQLDRRGAHYDLHRPTNDTDVRDLTYDQEGEWGGLGDMLEAYTDDESSLGLAFNANADRLIFYIGNDSAIHQFHAIDDSESDGLNNSGWHTSGSPDNAASAWPRADIPNADFTVAYDSDLDKIWLYYVVNGSMTQVHQSSAGVWEPAVALPKFNATAAVVKPEPPEPESGGDSGGLSGSGKVGVGVGVGLGIPIIGAIIAAYTLWHVRRSRQSHEADLAVAAAPAVTPGSPAPQYTSGYWGDGGQGAGLGYWANGQWVQPHPDLVQQQQQQQQQQVYAATGGAKPDGSQWQQLDPRFSQMYLGGGSPPPAPVHEMAHQEPAYEVAGDGQVPEMPGSQQQSAPTPIPATAPAPAPIPSEQQSCLPDARCQGPTQVSD